MIAYDRIALSNLKITEHAGKWRQSKLISEPQEKNIRDNHPIDFYRPNFFVRVILFAATVLAIGSTFGLVAYLLDIQSPEVGSPMCFAAGLLLYGVLEKIIIAQKKYYQAGIDDALLYMALAFVLAGVFVFLNAFEIKLQEAYYYLLTLPFLVWGVIRFADKFLTLAAIYCFFYYVFYRLFSLGQVGKSIMPFTVMVFSCLLFLLSIKLMKPQKNEPWETPLTILKTMSLTAFYLGGNYLVVRELSEELLGLAVLQGEDIPLAPVFYILTIAVPVLYILVGIKKRDINFLRIGLLTAAFSIFTFRYYFFDLSYELSIALAGTVLIVLALATLKFLKKPVGGFTAKNLLNLSPDSPQFEAFLLADLSKPGTEISDKQDLFGGGRSGGAGAEGQY